jgi:hypothetical protein
MMRNANQREYTCRWGTILRSDDVHTSSRVSVYRILTSICISFRKGHLEFIIRPHGTCIQRPLRNSLTFCTRHCDASGVILIRVSAMQRRARVIAPMSATHQGLCSSLSSCDDLVGAFPVVWDPSAEARSAGMVLA